MYEEKKFFSNINWKTLIIKFVILLLIVFFICWFVFRPKKDNNFISLDTNINSVKDAAIEYFKNNKTLENIGDYAKITLKELEDNEYIVDQEDSKGNSCDNEKSYAYLTKTRDNEYILKINMVCNDNKESKTFNLTNDDLTVIAKNEEEEDNTQEDVIADEDTPVIEPDINEPIKEEEPSIKDEIIEDNKEIADNSSDTKKEEEKENNKVTIDFGNDTLIEELHNPNSNKVLRYKHIKYGEWIEGIRYSPSIENSTKEVIYYEYCLNDYCVEDRSENQGQYIGYTATYKRTEIIPVYRYVYVVWSNSCCIKGFVNTGIAELR